MTREQQAAAEMREKAEQVADDFDLDALKALEKDATPRPWKTYYDGNVFASTERGDKPICERASVKDAAYICALRNAAPALFAAAALRDAAADRNSRHSKLVYDKEKRTIVHVDTYVEPKPDPRDAALAKARDVLETVLSLIGTAHIHPSHVREALTAIESALKANVP